MKKWNIDIVSDTFNRIYGNKAILLSNTYKNTKTKLHAHCNIHHCDVYTTWDKLKLGQLGCKHCRYAKVSQALTHTNKWYRGKLKDTKFVNLQPYENRNKAIKHLCKECNHIFMATPNAILKSKNCPYCDTLTLFTKDCIQYHIDKVHENHTYKLINDDVHGNTDYVDIYHISCDTIFNCKLNNILSGNGCPYCAGNIKKTPKEYYGECKERGLDLPLGDYVNTKTKIKHKCNKCGYIYAQMPNDHLYNGTSCPKCNESHGEKYIRNYLDTNNIKYESQKRFSDLKDKKPLSYDFYLPKYKILIEYQGEQHYESRKFNGKEGTNLELQQLHDKLKKDYARANGYRLLELHYSLDTQEKVNQFLERRIKD